MNAQMRRIDLICKLGGPLVIALLDGVSTSLAVLVTLSFNIVSLGLEYISIAKASSQLLRHAEAHWFRSLTDYSPGLPSCTSIGLASHSRINSSSEACLFRSACLFVDICQILCVPTLSFALVALPHCPLLQRPDDHISTLGWLLVHHHRSRPHNLNCV